MTRTKPIKKKEEPKHVYSLELTELIKPIHLTDNREYIDVNDFPGDNMIEE